MWSCFFTTLQPDCINQFVIIYHFIISHKAQNAPEQIPKIQQKNKNKVTENYTAYARRNFYLSVYKMPKNKRR